MFCFLFVSVSPCLLLSVSPLQWAGEEVTAHLELPYGKGKVSFDLPPGWEADFFRPNPVPWVKDPQGEVLRSIENPIGPRRIEDFRGVKSAAIAISDETR
ncbi:MAG: DUF2088 domain-containing protein, partial [Deltaproteobacteria bacterium]